MFLEPTVVFWMLCGQALPNGISFDYGQIEHEIQLGELQPAAVALENRLKNEDGDFRAHMLLGIVRQEEGQAEEALKELYRAQTLRPADPAPHVNLGKVLMSQGQPAKAIAEFEDAIRLDPRNATARINLGMLLFQQKKWPQAIAELKAAVAITPADAQNWFLIFQSYLAMRNFESARTAAAHLRVLSPPTSELFRAVGASQAAAGDYEGAIPNLEEAMEASPDSNETAYNLGLAWLRSGHPDKAAPLINALAKREENAEVEDLLGEIDERLGLAIDAVRAFQKAAELDPGNEDYAFDYVSELLAHKSFDAAILVARAAADKLPSSLKLQLALCGALYGNGNVEEAHGVAVDASQKFPESNLPLYLRNVIADAGGNPDTSLLAQTKTYLEGHPKDATGWLILGQAEARQGEPAEAMDSLNRSLAIKEESAEAHFAISRIYFDEGKWQQVVSHSRRAIELGLTSAVVRYRLSQALYRLGRKSEGDLEMKSYRDAHRVEEEKKSAVATFIYTLR